MGEPRVRSSNVLEPQQSKAPSHIVWPHIVCACSFGDGCLSRDGRVRYAVVGAADARRLEGGRCHAALCTPVGSRVFTPFSICSGPLVYVLGPILMPTLHLLTH